MKQTTLPSLWFLVMVVGLPLFSETLYTPSLPDIAKTLAVSDSWVEYTLTIYLFAFAIGTLFWGRLSDRLGRKPCLLMGLFIYILGCIGCFASDSIEMLMLSRFIQAFGGSTGSVLGQAICRDAFQGITCGKAYSTIGSSLAFAPAIGPFIGGLMDQTFGWPSLFLLLSGLGIMVWLATYAHLTETHSPTNVSRISIKHMMLQMLKDKKVLAFCILVAACNGILFSYYAEGPFYLINILGLTPSIYGASFLGIAVAGASGGYLSRTWHNHMTSIAILERGIKIVIAGCTFFMIMALTFDGFQVTKMTSIVLTLTSMIVIAGGIGMVIPNALSLALEDYRHAIGTASALFGFFYYMLISLFTLGMGEIHNDTLLPMPLYFWGISLLMGVTVYLRKA
jgi:DHA1 family bicyclomycin/chloramphenicol resistance-like MFS transporter